MKHLTLLILALTLFSTSLLLAQSNVLAPEAKYASIGHASIADNGVESVFTSTVMIVEIQDFSVGASYSNAYAISELSNRSIAAVLPYRNYAFGFAFLAFGPSEWLSTRSTLTLSRRLSQSINAAVNLQYFSQKLPEENQTVGQVGYAVSASAMVYQSNFVLSVQNLGIGDIKTANNRIEMYWNIDLGGRTRLSEFNTLYYQINFTDERSSAQLRIGTEWSIRETLKLRFGYHSKPHTSTFGFGVLAKSSIINLGFSYKQPLGVSAHISVMYTFTNQKKSK